MVQKKVRFAVVGVGGLGRAHLEGIKNNSDIAEAVAICDIDEKFLKVRGDAFGIPEERRYNSVEAMLAAEKELDAADVCVWNINHAPCAIAALICGRSANGFIPALPVIIR